MGVGRYDTAIVAVDEATGAELPPPPRSPNGPKFHWTGDRLMATTSTAGSESFAWQSA
jgi:hypothetical protein